MGTVATGEMVIILEFTREKPAVEFVQFLKKHYETHPRKFLEIHPEYMPESTAKLYRHILAEPSASPPTAPAKNAAAHAPAASPPAASRFRQTPVTLSPLMWICLLGLWFVFLVTLVAWLFLS